MVNTDAVKTQEYCYGCGLYVEHCVSERKFKEYLNTHICPCGTCLIKGVCQEACEVFSVFSQKYHILLKGRL